MAFLALAADCATRASADAVGPIPKECTFQPLGAPFSTAEGASSCFTDHWCHQGHKWCEGHKGVRTLPYGAPGCRCATHGSAPPYSAYRAW